MRAAFGPGPARRTRAAIAATLALALSGCGTGAPLRLVESDGVGRVEVEWVSFDPPKGRPPVLFVSMVHVASEAFYRGVQATLDRSAVVLMEGVKPSPKASNGETDQALRRLRAAYEGTAATLDLAAQSSALVVRPYWRAPDLTAAEISGAPSFEAAVRGSEALRARLADFRARLERALPPDRAVDAVRRSFARELVGARYSEDETLIVRRNDAAMRALLDLTDVEGRVAVCFGAAHASHFFKALEREGWRRTTTDFVVLFDYRLETPSDPGREPAR